MVKRFSFFIINLFLCLSAFAQSDSIALRINDKPIYLSQMRDAAQNAKDNGLDFDINSYIDRLILVEEAKEQKLDTLLNYKREMSTAKIMFSEQYENNHELEDSIVRMMYNRLLIDVDINHIFIPLVSENEIVLPNDPMLTKAYKLAEEKRQSLLNKEKLTDYSQARGIVRNLEVLSGHLGWVLPFTMPNEVEYAMYNLPIGEVSQPIRYGNGLHIVQVLERRPAKGVVNYEQVTFNFHTIPPSQKTIDSLWNVVKDIEVDLQKDPNQFTQLCEAYNKAHNLDRKNCSFQALSLNDNMPPAFINATFDLQHPGDVSKAILTDYGYHFIRLINFSAINSLESIRSMLINKIRSSDRASYIDELWLNKYRQQFNLQVNTNIQKRILEIAKFHKPLDTIFVDKLADFENEVVFSIENNPNFLVKDLINILNKNRAISKHNRYQGFEDEKLVDISTSQMNDILQGCIRNSVAEYKDSTLIYREPKLRATLQKISEDVLLYYLKKKNIWSKSQITIDEKIEYFKKNKNDFKWNAPHYKGLIVESKSESQLDSIRTYYNRLINKSDAKQILISEFKAIRLEEGTWEADYPQIKLYLENSNISKNKEYPYFIFFGKTLEQPENFRDVVSELDRRMLLQREKDWIQSLKETKYKVEINATALTTVK